MVEWQLQPLRPPDIKMYLFLYLHKSQEVMREMSVVN